MARLPFSSLRVRITLLVLLAVVPALGLTLYTDAEERQQTTNMTQAMLLNQAQLAANDQQQLVESTRQVLALLSGLAAVRDGDTAACSTQLAKLLQQSPHYLNLGAAKPDGDVFCSAIPLSGPTSVSDRAYFRRALETRDFAVGEYQIGRITGKPSLNFGYPLFDVQGNVQAVLLAALDLSWLNQLAATAQLPEGATLIVIDRNALILARYPDSEQWVGKTVPEAAHIKVILAQGTGTAVVVGVDGVSRLYAFMPLHSTAGVADAYVSIGIPTAFVFAETERTLTRNLSALGLAAVLALAAAWLGSDLFILRRVKALLNATARLSTGDLSARSGLAYGVGELSQLARAFDEMAEALGQLTRRNAQILNSAGEGIYGVDLQGQTTFVNPAAASMIGWDVKDLIGQSMHDRSHHSKADGTPYRREACPIYATFTDGEIHQVDSEVFWQRDGTSFPVEYTCTPMRDERGTLVGAVVTFKDITERKRADEQIQRQLQRLAALRAIDMAINSSLDLRLTLNVLLKQVIQQLSIEAADILLLNPTTQTLEYAAGRGFQTRALRDTRLRLGEGYAGRAALERRLVRVSDLSAAPGDLVRSPLLEHEGFSAYYAAPLTAKGQVKGVLELFHRTPLDPDPEWLDFLEALAEQAAIAIDNAELFNDLQHSNVELALAYDTTLEGWSRALDLRDKETEGHTLRVTQVTIGLARAMGLSEAELVHVRRGVLLHDIGKMGIPDSILLKPGPLTEAEWVTMRQHPLYAYQMLAPIAYLRPALDIPYCHHEKWDGTGYPHGLKDEQIPLAARIFAVVDVWDALRSDRPYRQGWPEDQVRTYLSEQAGQHFDPKVVATFLDLLLDGNEPPARSPAMPHCYTPQTGYPISSTSRPVNNAGLTPRPNRSLSAPAMDHVSA